MRRRTTPARTTAEVCQATRSGTSSTARRPATGRRIFSRALARSGGSQSGFLNHFLGHDHLKLSRGHRSEQHILASYLLDYIFTLLHCQSTNESNKGTEMNTDEKACNHQARCQWRATKSVS